MPTKRRVIAARAIGRMNDNQRDHLISGFYFWDGSDRDRFRDEEHRRATWAAYRHEILADWCFPGRRPVALWEYDLGDWSCYGESEADAVYGLLRAGQLEGCRRNGNIRITSELEQIETDWLQEITASLHDGRGVRKITKPLPTYGCPARFYREHAPGIAARLAAEYRAYRLQQRPPVVGEDDV